MKTAFEILGVSEDADDVSVKQAYLLKVKQFPPERATAQFQQIRAAYELIKDARSRIKYQLFHQPDVDFNTMLEQAFTTDPVNKINGESIVKLLQNSVE